MDIHQTPIKCKTKNNYGDQTIWDNKHIIRINQTLLVLTASKIKYQQDPSKSTQVIKILPELPYLSLFISINIISRFEKLVK
jgi:hypothetical protein